MSTVIGSRIITMRHRTTGGAGVVVVKISPTLPYPAVLRRVSYWQSAPAPDSLILAARLLLAADDSTATANITGADIFQHKTVGTSPPDVSVEIQGPLSIPATNLVLTFDVNVPVPNNAHFLKSVLLTSTATGGQAWWWCTFDLLDAPDAVPGADIRPRGTADEPLCVRICDGSAPPNIPPNAPGAPETPTPPVTTGAADILANPLPAASDVPPAAPLAAASALCEVP
jgi:hypothetical protein